MVRVPLLKTFRFGTLAIPFTPLCQCLSEETLKAVGPFYLVSTPGEVKDPTSPHWNVSLLWTPPPTLNPPEVHLCSGKRCPALNNKKKVKICLLCWGALNLRWAQ